MNIERGEELKEKSVESSGQKTEEKLLARKPWGEILKEKIGQFKEAMGFSKSSKKLEEKMKEEISLYENEYIIEGVNFSRCQPEKIVKAKKAGKKIEVEPFSPYLSDYNTATGKIWRDALTNIDKIGLAIGKMLRIIFPEARVISLYDEYNSEMPDTSNLIGAPSYNQQDKNIKQIRFSEEQREIFRNEVKEVMQENGVIREGDEEGKDYLLVSETSKIKDAENLVERLRKEGFIKEKGGDIFFHNPNAENPKFEEIKLKKSNGQWMCEALDSSAFIKQENLDTTHLVILPNSFKEQQDKVWEILKVLGIKPDNYHNIFFDEKMNPKKVAEIIEREFKKYL